MPRQKKPKGYWNKERCRSVALGYDTRSNFARGDKTAYNVAADAGWLDELCFHMPRNAKGGGQPCPRKEKA